MVIIMLKEIAENFIFKGDNNGGTTVYIRFAI